MAAFRSLFLILALPLVAEMAMGANHTVGAPGGSWDLKTNFATWASAQKFTVNDLLIFQYPTTQHNVLEVTKSNYDSCGLSSPIGTYATGDDAIRLSSAGKRYFICGIPTHCTLGMKVEIDTVAASAPTTPASPPPKTSTPGMMSPPPKTSTTGTMSPPPMSSTPGTMLPPPTPSSGSKLQVLGGLGFGFLMLFAF